MEGEGDISQEVLLNLGKIAREIEHLCQGIPQDIEWTYDGEKFGYCKLVLLLPLNQYGQEKLPPKLSPESYAL